MTKIQSIRFFSSEVNITAKMIRRRHRIIDQRSLMHEGNNRCIKFQKWNMEKINISKELNWIVHNIFWLYQESKIALNCYSHHRNNIQNAHYKPVHFFSIKLQKSRVFTPTNHVFRKTPDFGPKSHPIEATKESASHHSKARKFPEEKIRFGNVRKSRFDGSELVWPSAFS